MTRRMKWTRCAARCLQAIIEKVGAERFPAPLRLDDAAWVGYRLAEVLPLDARVKQDLLELTDAGVRLERLRGAAGEQARSL